MNFSKVIQLLKKQGKTISTMESCTGGSIVSTITNHPGASEVLSFSAVTYANEFKIKMGVSPKTITNYSVYSLETAKEMSQKITEFANSDYGVGVTGKLNIEDIENPEGEKDVVYVSIYDKEKDKYWLAQIKVTKRGRKANKKIVIKKIQKMLLEILDHN